MKKISVFLEKLFGIEFLKNIEINRNRNWYIVMINNIYRAK